MSFTQKSAWNGQHEETASFGCSYTSWLLSSHTLRNVGTCAGIFLWNCTDTEMDNEIQGNRTG